MKRALKLSAALVALLAIAAPRAQASCDASGAHTALPGGLQAQINLIPATVGPGDYCIQMNSGGAFNEVITIGTHSFADAFSRIIISSGLGASPLISNSSGTGAIVNIYSDSVTFNGVWITPNGATQNGVQVNANFVKLTNLNVGDVSAQYTGSAVQLNGQYDEIFGSSVAARTTAAYGVQITSLSYGAKVVQSTVSAQGTAGQSALDIDSYGALVSGSYIEQVSGSNATALSVQFTSGTQILASTVAIVSITPASNAGIYLNNASSVVMSSLTVLSAAIGVDFHATSASTMTYSSVTAAGHGAYFEGTSNNDVISYSTITNTNTGAAVEVVGAGNLLVDWSVLYKNNNSNNTFEALTGGTGGHVISHSSVTCNAGGSYGAVYFNQPNSTVSDSFLSANFGAGVVVDNVSGITVTKSTMTSRTNSQGTLWLNNASNATITNVSVFNPDGDAALVEAGANNNTIGNSTFTSASTGAALRVKNTANNNYFSGSVLKKLGGAESVVHFQNSAASNTITTSFITAVSSNGINIDQGPFSNTISFSTVTASAANSAAVIIYASSMNTLTNDYLQDPSGDALRLHHAGYNTLFNSTLYSNSPATYAALRMIHSSSNTITAIFALAPNGTPGYISDLSGSNTISQSTFTTSANGGSGISVTSGGNTITQSYIAGYGSPGNGLFIAGFASGMTVSLSTSVGRGVGGDGGFFSMSNSTITQSVFISTAGIGLVMDAAAVGSVVSDSLITGSTGVYVTTSQNSTIFGSTITSTGLGASGVALASASGIQIVGSSITATGTKSNGVFASSGGGHALVGSGVTAVGTGFLVTGAPANSTTTIVGSTLTATTALSYNGAASSVLSLFGEVDLHGQAGVLAGGLRASSNLTVFGGDVTLGPSVFTNVVASTFAFYGANEVPVRTAQTLDVQAVTPPNLNYVDLSVASFTAKGNSFLATQLQDLVAGSTVAFAAGTSPAYNISFLALRGGVGANQRVVFRSTAPFAVVNLNVSASTVTLAMVRDQNNGSGGVIHANDGTSVDAGNNAGWNFKPQLAITLPGESWVDGVGKSGAPSAQTAGIVPVTVRAVSNSNVTLNSSISVTAGGSDANDDTLTQSLSAGVSVFSLALRKGEPAPVNHTLTATSAGAYAGAAYTDTVQVSPGALNKLQILLPGETADPGSPSGKTGTPTGAVAGLPYTVTVRGADSFYNIVSAASDQVRITTSGANLPQTQTLAGSTSFSNVIFASSAAARTIVAMDMTNGAITASTSTALTVFAPTTSSPTVSVNIANNSIQTSLGGMITGTASDPTGVTGVSLQLVRSSDQQSFDWITSFTPSAISTPAALGTPGGATTGWSVPIADASLAANSTYYLVVKSNNASGNQITAVSTFTFNPSFGQVGSLGDGQGSAAVAFRDALNPASPRSIGCGPVIASMTFVAGPNGINNGGAIAVHLPDSWSAPSSTAAAFPGTPPAVPPGILVIQAPFTYTIDLAPTTQNNATFGSNWFIYRPTQNIPPGATVTFKVSAFTGGGPQAVGPQTFLFQTQGGPTGQFKPIAGQPTATLSAGPADSLQFSNQQFMTLGPLQTSATMQLVVNDACGNSTNTASNVTASFTAYSNGGADAGAQFWLAGAPVNQVVIPGNAHTSPSFYFVTATPGPSFEQLSASATLTTSVSYATRYAQVLASSVSITGVSVDTGTLAPGVKVATITPGSFSGAAVFNFTLSNPNTPWELIISTSPGTFFPEIVHRNGYGQPGRSVTWNGITETTFPQTLVKPGGPYWAKIRVGGGVVEDNTLAVYMATSAYVYGTVNSTGAFAYVQAQGPNTSFANFAVADQTGYFEIHGLQNGGRYNIVATTGSVINGQFVQLQTSSNNVTAVNTGTDVGSIPFPTPTFLRLRVQIPQPAPFEFWGGFNAFSNTGQNAWGTLHYLAGLDKSDDGSGSFGAGSASTWTVVGVTPGTYNLQINLPQVSISSQLPNVSIPAGTTTDLFLALERKANVYGWAVVPSTTQYGSWVSVQGQKAGDPRPTIFGGTFLQGSQFGVAQSSNVYSLFGLDPGTWTITARGSGFGSTSTVVFISSNTDIGDPANGGLNLTMSAGTVLNGELVITGDSRNLPQASNGGLTVYINAYNPQTYSNGFAQVFISTDAVLARSTFSITGLDVGTYFLNTWVQGAQTPQISTAVTAGGGYTTMGLTVDDARAAVTVLLPPNPPPDFHKVGMFYQGMNVQPTAVPDFQALPGVTVFTTSATWISPKFSPGYFGFMAADTVHGTFATTPVQIRNGGTTQAVIDLRGSTYTVSGTVVVAGNVDFNVSGAAVSVSSVAGVLANAAPAEYCLAGHLTSVTSSTFHLELLPVARQGSYYTQPLITLPAAGNCPTQLPFSNNNNGDVVNPLLAYVVTISTDGSFTIPNVPPGSYVLRVPTSLSASGFGNELPPVHQFISVSTSDVSGLTFTISRGVGVTGNLRMPPGLQSSRGMQVSINDANGTPVKTSFVSFNNSNSAPYTLDRVPDGSYALVVQDFGYPKSFGARPITLKVSGAAINQDIQLVQTGVIKGKLAVQQFLPNSTTAQFVLVDAHNADQLPNSFFVYAEANPWFQGGRTTADSSCGAAGGGGNCGGGKPNFDDNGQFSISGVLPGLYDIHFESHNDATEQSTIRLVSSLAPGVSVNGGATTDMGTYNLTSALSVRGKVTDATNGAPIANMPVTAQPALSQNHDVDRPDATTDASGNYTLVGLDPTIKVYDIYAGKRQDHSGAPPPPYELKIAPSVDVTSVAVQNFAMTPASYSISGLVRGAAGGPALTVPFNGDSGTQQLGAAIFLQKSGVQPHDNPIADVMQQTDPQGRFTVPSLTTGTYKLTVVSLGYTSYSQNVTISSQSVTVPTITLGQGATLTGALRKPDGSNPGQREIDLMVAVTNNFSQLLVATLTPDSNANTYTNYSIAGFQPGVSYKVLIFGKGGTSAAIAPAEGQNIVFSTTTETRSLDMVLRPAAPYVFSKSKKSAGKFSLRFELSQPLRNSRPADNDLASILSTFSALGTLSNLDLDATRSILTAQYTPGVSESSFTIRIHGFSTQTDPDSLDPVNPQFVYDSTFSFFNGIDGYYANVLSNFNGGTLLVEDDNGRVAIPGGAFQVDASSSVRIGLALSNEALSGAAAASAAGYKGAAANIKAMRYSGSAYPQEIFRAMAATPPQVSPLSSFYNILLPLGIRTSLQKPVPLTISYSTNTDPTTLNLYWYNAAANAYVLQQDVTGAKPVIDTLNHTVTINVNHFSTFVLFNTGVAVISGNTFGGEFTAYNFPNPFDLSVKNVTAINGGGGSGSVRGTQIQIGLPPDISGDASIKIYNVAGEKVRTISLGTLQGGFHYYQPWDGRNDSGRDCASGVYIAQVKVGDHNKFFKMALIK